MYIYIKRTSGYSNKASKTSLPSPSLLPHCQGPPSRSLQPHHNNALKQRSVKSAPSIALTTPCSSQQPTLIPPSPLHCSQLSVYRNSLPPPVLTFTVRLDIPLFLYPVPFVCFAFFLSNIILSYLIKKIKPGFNKGGFKMLRV